MKNYFCVLSGLLYVFCSAVCLGAMPRDIPDHLKNEFTFFGKIPVSYDCYEDKNFDQSPSSINLYDSNIQKAILRQCGFLGQTDFHLYNALDDLHEMICGKNVAVIGSRNAWYESILLAYGVKPIVILDNPIEITDSRIKYLTQEEYWKNPEQFDLVISMTNTASAGFGNQGEAIDPNGDLKLMESVKRMLTPVGKLLLAIPVGPDELVWDTHRVYGEIRLKLLLQGWRVKKYYGFTSEYMFYGVGYHPIFLLHPK